MKSFIVACILLLSVTLFVVFNAHTTVSAIDEMLALADTLPQTAADFEYGEAEEKVLALTALWDQKFPCIAFTAGYENTNRCDEAIGALTIHFKNQNALDFAVSLSEFKDTLERLRILEGFHHEGIF